MKVRKIPVSGDRVTEVRKAPLLWVLFGKRLMGSDYRFSFGETLVIVYEFYRWLPYTGRSGEEYWRPVSIREATEAERLCGGLPTAKALDKDVAAGY